MSVEKTPTPKTETVVVNKLMKLLNIQSQARVKKTNDGSNAYIKFNWRSAEDIIGAIQPILFDQKAVIVMVDEIEEIGNRFYLKAVAKLYCAETGDVIMENHAYAREATCLPSMSEPQTTGASSSYARKYALQGLLLINDRSQDPDSVPSNENSNGGRNYHGKQPQQQKKQQQQQYNNNNYQQSSKSQPKQNNQASIKKFTEICKINKMQKREFLDYVKKETGIKIDMDAIIQIVNSASTDLNKQIESFNKINS